MEKFWPTLPFLIPTTEGTQMWWDIFWWIFQIVIMSTLIILLTKWALKMDQVWNMESKKSSDISGGTDGSVKS
jgi:hypothetical protein